MVATDNRTITRARIIADDSPASPRDVLDRYIARLTRAGRSY